MTKFRIKIIDNKRYIVQYKFLCFWRRCSFLQYKPNGGSNDFDSEDAYFFSRKDAIEYLEWIKSPNVTRYKGEKIVKTFEPRGYFHNLYINVSYNTNFDDRREWEKSHDVSFNLQDLIDIIDERNRKEKITYEDVK